MRTVNRSALVPYTAREMFVLVDDVESYPQFLPWCNDAEVHNRTENTVEATLETPSGYKLTVLSSLAVHGPLDPRFVFPLLRIGFIQRFVKRHVHLLPCGGHTLDVAVDPSPSTSQWRSQPTP